APLREQQLQLLWGTLALVVIILVGALVIVWLKGWRKQSRAGPLSTNEQLAQFRELYEQGELSQKEFERIRATLAQQLRVELDVPGEPSVAPPEARPSAGASQAQPARGAPAQERPPPPAAGQ